MRDTDHDELGPPSVQPDAEARLGRLAHRLEQSVGALGDFATRLESIERNQRLQGNDMDLVMNSLQQILIEFQLPGAAERVRQAIERRHPPHSLEDAIAKTPDNRGVQ